MITKKELLENGWAQSKKSYWGMKHRFGFWSHPDFPESTMLLTKARQVEQQRRDAKK